jgi:DNA helicase-2/ATP-dependent DNA helicase PcrA
MSFKPSKYQQAIFTALITTGRSLAVEAGPGSGKTSTIVEAAKLLPYGKKAVFVAFNKSIVLELKKRLPPTVMCHTMHHIGSKAIFAAYGGEKKINPSKQITFIEPYFEKDHPRKKWPAIYAVDKIMQLARATMTTVGRKEIEELCGNYALDYTTDQLSISIKALRKLYNYNDDPDKWDITIDFQDMIEMCVRNREIIMPQFDYVFIDEAQDLSKLDQIFINRLVKPVTGRKIVVGDPKQSIYGFRGSDPNSFQSFVNEKNTIQLPLSISYRCAKSIVREAKQVYNDIEEHAENQEGIVRKGDPSEIEEGDMVLCRNTRPLIHVFLELVKVGKKAYVVGKDMEKGLLGVLAPFDSEALTSDVKEKLGVSLEQLKAELISRGILKPENHSKYAALQEKIAIVKLIFGNFNTVGEVERFIETVFDDEDRDGVALMTIHRSKGLENDRVFIIESFEGNTLIPSPYAVTSDQLKQEKNLKFVAITRAKKELVKLTL